MAAHTWEVASNPDEVHELLCTSDRFQAGRFDSPVPTRNPATTAKRVAAGVVHLLRVHDQAAAMFTLTWEPAFEEPSGVFPAARRPAYLGRLAVRPDLAGTGSLAGAQCVRRALSLAREQGADMIRAEANPDLEATVDMLVVLGFTRCEQVFADDTGRRRVHLYQWLGDTPAA
ncbi:GNAT family N-acetyltransferase [Kutzneria albida]|uniref:N-acetyltransferase domain-containing protein n=1 Tax=Kutzneria albida DSM 43870 TaxID=1449976 RepID=W5WD02_9PSEU|nr:GNAT family N-acetyltransferase [Kutzneria albida]AHH99058.1 hypothetical protein KALB_5697 [Kutzneria albida DSM 43870]